MGSAGRAPDDIIEQNKQLWERCKEFFLLEPILKTFFDYSLGGYSHRSAGRAPDEISDSKNNKEGERKLV
jgi:hypothetical protein